MVQTGKKKGVRKTTVSKSRTTKRVYTDYAAATPVDPRVLSEMIAFQTAEFANPSAIHSEGVRVGVRVMDARASIATELGALVDEVRFMGSATESANIALRGAVAAWRRTYPDQTPEIIVSAIEHAAVLETALALTSDGVRVHFLPVDADGFVNASLLRTLLTPQTVLVSVLYVNNEIGTIQPVREIAKILREWRFAHGAVTKEEVRYPLLHTDACQASMFLPIHMRKLGVDLLTLNAAKIYGPKGICLLLVRRGVLVDPVITGGGQEAGLHAGTEHVAGIIGFAAALRLRSKERDRDVVRMQKIHNVFVAALGALVPEVHVNGSLAARSPYNLNITIPGMDHEFVVIALDRYGIAASTKSACNALDAETSHVLAELRKADESGLPPQGIRFSFGRSTTAADVKRIAKTLRKIIDVFQVS